MPNPILDSSVVIGHLNDRAPAADYVDELLFANAAVLHGVTVVEVLCGARDKKNMRELRRYLAQFHVVLPTSEDFARSVDLLALHTLSHGIGWPDCLIAATCLRLRCPVATINVKHFRAVPGVEIERVK